MRKGSLICLALALGCDPNVVDAVRLPQEPPPDDNPGGSAGMPAETPMQTALIHRYSFDGEGDVVVDSQFAAHGRAIGVELTGNGTLSLAGEKSGQYVALPPQILHNLRNATFEAWLTWNGGSPWQRIFDFGTYTEDTKGNKYGSSYLFLTPFADSDTARQLPTGQRIAYAQKSVADEEVCNVQIAFPTKEPAHVAAVINHDADTMALYVNGALLLECRLLRPLSAIDDVNNWLGHSNYSADDDFSGTYDEFRIYNAALSAEEIADSFAAGPNVVP